MDENRLEYHIMRRLKEAPEKRCLFWQDRWWTRGEFAERVEMCVEVLESSGFREGYRIVTMLPNSPLLLALSVAVWRLGGAMVPLNHHMGTEVIANVLHLVDPFAVVLCGDKGELGEVVEALGYPRVRASLEGEISTFSGRKCSVDDRSLAVVFTTSGTTGLPKAVPISHENLLDNTLTVLEHVTDIRPDEVLLNVLPNFHTFGFCLSGTLPLVHGLAQVVLPSFMPPSRTLKVLYGAGVTALIAVPTIISILCEAIARGPKVPPPSLRVIVCGGAPLNERIHRKAEEVLGLPILEGYGLTECSPVVAAARTLDKIRPGTIGPMMEGYEAQIRDRDGNQLDIHVEGVLWLRGPSVAAGYFRSPEATASRFDGDGWFNTGDVVRIGEDGYISILDRETDIIIVGGFNVYPQEVERVVEMHPSVREAAVVGISNYLSGELVKAFIVLQEGAPEPAPREISAFCRERLSHYKIPRQVEIVSELPRSPIGKVLRRKLRDLETVR